MFGINFSEKWMGLRQLKDGRWIYIKTNAFAKKDYSTQYLITSKIRKVILCTHYSNYIIAFLLFYCAFFDKFGWNWEWTFLLIILGIMIFPIILFYLNKYVNAKAIPYNRIIM